VLKDLTVIITFTEMEKAMIDFKNSSLVKLGPVNPGEVQANIQPLLVNHETIMIAAKGIRDYVVFTNRRVIVVNVQGMTGTKKAFASLPYKKLQAWSIETAGTVDLDSEVDLWYSSVGQVHLEFSRGFDIVAVSRLLAEASL
jgi:hypothetical protein